MKKIIGLILIVLLVALSGCYSIFEQFTTIGSTTTGSTNTGNTNTNNNINQGSTNRQTSNIDVYSFRTDTPDPLINRIPQNIENLRNNNPDEYIRQIAAFIKSNSVNDFDMIKKAHDFVAVTTSYDADSFLSNRIPNQSYQNVLRTRLAVCEGYAALFKKLCDELGVTCIVVHGYARGVGSSAAVTDRPSQTNHAWNMITVNGQSYLIDCTWDSGYLDGRVFRQRYTTDYLFQKPEFFIYSHFPTNAQHQLLARPLNADQFIALPPLKPKFFDVADNLSINLQRINRVNDRFSFEYTVKDQYYFSFRVTDVRTGRDVQNRSFVQRNGSRHTANFSFPSSGQYNITVFWWGPGSERGWGCGDFIVEASSGNRLEFPLIYSSSAVNLSIISPIESPLERGRTYTFRVRVDNKNNVAIFHGSTFIQLTKGSDGVFSAEYRIPNNISELFLGVADSERSRYESIARYQIQ